VHDIAGTIARDARDETQPLEGLPEFAPARLHLIGGQNPVGIGADGEEGGVAEVEEPGEADDDVEPERQDGEGAGIGGRVDVAVIVIDQRTRRVVTSNRRRFTSGMRRIGSNSVARSVRNGGEEGATMR
jgi:hypothetical protein